MAPPVTRNTAVDRRDATAGSRPPPGRKWGRAWSSDVFRKDVNAPRSDAAETPWRLPGHSWTKCGGARAVSCLLRKDVNAPRSDAGWVRREINCTAGWSCAGRSWRWHGPWVAIRPSTDERRAQTRGASKRVRVLQELRARAERERRISSSKGQSRGASKRVRDLLELRARAERERRFSRQQGPDPRRKQACARSPGAARGSRTRTTIFKAARPDRGASKRVRVFRKPERRSVGDAGAERNCEPRPGKRNREEQG